MTKLSDYPMTLTERQPLCNLTAPGVCQFTPTWTESPLLDRIPCGTGGTSYILRFGLPDATKPMGLTTCACLLAAAELEQNGNGEKVDVIRPYTPITTNNEVGCFDLLVKDYGENGWLSSYMCQDLPIGGTIKFKHIDFNVKIPAPFTHKKIGMIAGGTGITPMIQALHAILGKGEKSQQKNSSYKGERGFIDKEKIQKYLPPASDGQDVIIFVCGPPMMYEVLCGPRNEPEVKGILGELGYSSSQVFKF
ncbi:hypothetical protein ACHAXM_004244 [Skeletonema potamos]